MTVSVGIQTFLHLQQYEVSQHVEAMCVQLAHTRCRATAGAKIRLQAQQRRPSEQDGQELVGCGHKASCLTRVVAMKVTGVGALSFKARRVSWRAVMVSSGAGREEGWPVFTVLSGVPGVSWCEAKPLRVGSGCDWVAVGSPGAVLDEPCLCLASVSLVELSKVRDLIWCPMKLFLHDRLHALQARKIRS